MNNIVIKIGGNELTHWKTGKLLKRLPGMNDIIEECKKGKRGYQPYAIMKEHYQTIIYSNIKGRYKFNRVQITIDWYEPNSRRDVDNITAGCKFILDALVNAKVIKDDSQKYVASIHNNVFVDKKNPRIIVSIKEVDKNE